MAMNIYQKTKVIMLESSKCIPFYNKLAKILVESADITLNDLIDQIRKLVCSGRIIGSENRALYGEIKTEIMAYCDTKINEVSEPKKILKTELKVIIEEYKVKLNNSYDNKSAYDDFDRGRDVGWENAIEDVIDILEKLIK